MSISYEKLWNEGGYGKDNVLEDSLRYLEKKAKELNIPYSLIELSIKTIFLELAKGKKYSTTKCSCGCGIDKSGTDITHSILTKMIYLNKDRLKQLRKLIEKTTNTEIKAYLRRTRFKNFMNFDRSPVLKWIGLR